jgi:hypothetical protein
MQVSLSLLNYPCLPNPNPKSVVIIHFVFFEINNNHCDSKLQSNNHFLLNRYQGVPGKNKEFLNEGSGSIEFTFDSTGTAERSRHGMRSRDYLPTSHVAQIPGFRSSAVRNFEEGKEM